MNVTTLSVRPATLTRPLMFVAILLVAINLAMQLYRIYSGHAHVPGLAMMTLDGEHNVPALFSTVLLLLASGVLTVIAALAYRNQSSDALKWAILAAGFLLMAADESLSLHEMTMAPIRRLLGTDRLGLFYYAWVIPGIALIIVLALYFLPFLFRLPRRSAIAFVTAAAVYLGGAVGVELFEGWWRQDHGYVTLVYHLLVSLEEGMEMVGAILFIHALLRYIAEQYGQISLHLLQTAPQADANPAPSAQRGPMGHVEMTQARSVGGK